MEEQKRSRVSIISEEILGDKKLTPAEKMVYARICYFEEFFESSESTAEFLGLKVWTVQSAKRKLEKLGYISCVQNTGRGKRYVADVNLGVYNKRRVCSEQSQSLVETKSEFGENKVRLWKNQDIGKNISKKESIISKEIIGPKPEKPVKKEKTRILDENGNVKGGHPLTERAYELWNEIMGQPCKRDKWNSHAGYNMMKAKAKGEDWLKGMLILARECKKDTTADYRASHIANLADLQKNQEYVLDWYRKKKLEKETPADRGLEFLRSK